MADSILKIIPAVPINKLSEKAIVKAVDYLREKVDCDFIQFQNYETPSFIDCGSNLKNIICPICGKVINFEWWGEEMNHAAQSDFVSLMVQTPCCKRRVSLNDLIYDFPCGFACWEIDIYNPQEMIADEILNAIQGILKTDIKIVQAHL